MTILQQFFDVRRQQMMCLADIGDTKNWICYRHPDGQWVTLRKVTDDDLKRLKGAASFD